MLYMCGWAYFDPTSETPVFASMFKMDDQGDIKYFYTFGDVHTKTTGGNPNAPVVTSMTDVCRAITYDEDAGLVVMALEVMSPHLRPSYSSYQAYSDQNSDVVIILMRDNGEIKKGYNINFGSASISMGVGGNSLFMLDGEYIFGGQSYGYKTKYQNVTYDTVAPTYDSYVFKYNPDESGDCFFTDDLSAKTITTTRTETTAPAVKSNLFKKLTPSKTEEMSKDRFLFKKMNNLFLGYTSKYSGAFDLVDTFKYPRMCAQESINMTKGVQYYRGQNEFPYAIGKEGGATGVVSKMDKGQTWLFQNGTAAGPYLGRWARYDKGGTIYVNTTSEDAVGKARTILRGCSRFNELIELYLYIEVLNNNYPDFVTDVETTWTLAVGDVYEYKLPKLSDPEGNDEPEVYVNSMPNQEYPPFLHFNNKTKVLNFRPDSVWYQGLSFYFTIVVKEKNSDTVMYPHYCTVKIQGDKIDPMKYLNFTDIEFEMSNIARNSTGTLKWNHPVNLTFIQDHWDELFDVYIWNVTKRAHNTTMTLIDFNFTELADDSMTMKFQATFYQPYMLGLLVKKSDNLYIHMKYDLLDTKGFFRPEKKIYEGMFLAG